MRSWLKNKIETIYPGVEFDVSVPPDPRMGDYSVNLPFILARESRRNTEEVGKEFVDRFKQDGEFKQYFSKVELAGRGFVNFHLAQDFLQKNLLKIHSRRESFGGSEEGEGRIIIVEYSSPNIAKPMHIGHLRSTIIGDALANVYEALGYKIIRWNYIGDWGTQFGRLIAAWKKWGEESEGADIMDVMLKLYVRYHEEMQKYPELDGLGREEFRKLERGDPENRKLWSLFKEKSIREFKRTYHNLNINFNFERDVAKGESDYEKDIPKIVELLKPKLKNSEGALVLEFPAGLIAENPSGAIIVKSDGASVYLTRELATLKDRLDNRRPDKILYVVANQQSLHFQQLFAVAKMLGWNGAELVHVKFGMVLGEDGKKLATREGKVVFLQEVVDRITALAGEAVKSKNPGLAKEQSDKIANAVGIGALKYNDLKQHPYTDITFNWKSMLDISGNSGSYLQYTYARLANIITRAGERPGKSSGGSQTVFAERSGDTSFLIQPGEIKLMKRLLEFPDAIAECAVSKALNGLALYLYELSNDANRFYESVRVLDDDNTGRIDARLILVETTATVLKRGLNLLGIETLERI